MVVGGPHFAGEEGCGTNFLGHKNSVTFGVIRAVLGPSSRSIRTVSGFPNATALCWPPQAACQLLRNPLHDLQNCLTGALPDHPHELLHCMPLCLNTPTLPDAAYEMQITHFI